MRPRSSMHSGSSRLISWASLGGFVAQQLTLARPKQVRRLVLVGTGPRSGEGMATLTPEAKAIFGKTYALPDELWLEVFFSPTETSQAAGQAFLQRLRARKENRDPSINGKVAPAQIAAVEEWGAPRNHPYAYLKNIKQPVLIINGTNDVMIYTVNSFILQRNLPNARLIIYPDSNHGSPYQFPKLFVEHVKLFLGELSIGNPGEKLSQPAQARHWVEIRRSNITVPNKGSVIGF